MNNPTPAIASSQKSSAERYFYPVATVLLLVLTVVGFQLFYFHGRAFPGRPLTPPIRSLIIMHSVAMSLWMVLAILQPTLIAAGNRRLHMALGKLGAVIAAGLVVLGFKLGIAACQVTPPGFMHGPFTAKQFMAVPVLIITLFGLFVVAGILWRQRPERHKPMMFLASLAAVAAAIARIPFFSQFYAGTIWERLFGELFFTLVVGAVFLAAKCLVFRKFDRWFAAGFGVMVLWFLMIAQGAATPAWDAIASFLLR